MTTRITQDELESYLWGAAVVLRGLIDAGDYKQYIFPLVFLKRISDVYNEKHAAALKVYGDEDLADLPENHRFAVPDGCHWSDIRGVTTNIGAAILKAMRAIESANPETLPGGFGDGDWGNKNLLSDRTLSDLIEHFSTRILSIANLPEDELGNGYEYLIKRFADDSGHTAQEFYTNRTLVHLMHRRVNGRLEHLRGIALRFRNLINYRLRSLLEAGGFRPLIPLSFVETRETLAS
jgi:type I restriction-modification system DNA methylase subunit